MKSQFWKRALAGSGPVLGAVLLALVLLHQFPCEVEGRAGGGHSYSSSSSSRSRSSSHSSSRSSSSSRSRGRSSRGRGGGALDLLSVFGIIAIIVVLHVIKNYQRDHMDFHREVPPSFGRDVKLKKQKNLQSVLAKLKERDPQWNAPPFLARVKNAFTRIQKGWSDQDLGKAQQFMSDGLYERFLLQISGMRDEGVRDLMEGLRIDGADIIQFDSDPHFDTVHVKFTATAVNYRVSLENGRRLDGSTLPEAFTEVWSFVRRPGAKTAAKPGLIEGKCPNCGAFLEVGRVATCPACQSFLRSGEYDWVLSEITQACEWIVTDPSAIPGYSDFQTEDPGLSVQQVEDLASVVFWRLRQAERSGSEDPLRKFAAPSFLEAMANGNSQNPDGRRFFFTSCAVGSSRLRAVVPGDSGDRLLVEIRWSGKACEIDRSGKVLSRGGHPKNHHEILVFRRKHGAQTDLKTSLSSAHCPNCGAPEASGSEIVCPYCNATLNDGSKVWVLERLARPDDPMLVSVGNRVSGRDRAARESHSPAAGDEPGAWSPADSMRWVAAVMGADGNLGEKEQDLLRKMWAKNGIPESKQKEILAAARAGEAFPGVPRKPALVREVLGQMVSMALADGVISDEEIAVMRAVMKPAGMTDYDLKGIITREKNRLMRETGVGGESV